MVTATSTMLQVPTVTAADMSAITGEGTIGGGDCTFEADPTSALGQVIVLPKGNGGLRIPFLIGGGASAGPYLAQWRSRSRAALGAGEWVAILTLNGAFAARLSDPAGGGYHLGQALLDFSGQSLGTAFAIEIYPNGADQDLLIESISSTPIITRGWQAGGGVRNFGTFTAYAGAIAGNAYDQGLMQHHDDAIVAGHARLLALEDAVRAMGGIN